jgi:UDP-N-acetylmuramoylalanine--D-glutamate ligase
VACAYRALKAYGVSDEDIKKGFQSFVGVEGRLQYVGERKGVHIYNDNNATTPTATIAGIEALKGKGKLVVITGGADKKLSLDGFNEALDGVGGVVLLAGSGTEKLGRKEKAHESLKSAVAEALLFAGDGGTILFSPGFASFGMFKNEYDRNDRFLEAVKNIVAV